MKEKILKTDFNTTLTQKKKNPKETCWTFLSGSFVSLTVIALFSAVEGSAVSEINVLYWGIIFKGSLKVSNPEHLPIRGSQDQGALLYMTYSKVKVSIC